MVSKVNLVEFLGKPIITTASEYRMAILVASVLVERRVGVSFEGIVTRCGLNDYYYSLLKNKLVGNPLVEGLPSKDYVPDGYEYSDINLGFIHGIPFIDKGDCVLWDSTHAEKTYTSKFGLFRYSLNTKLFYWGFAMYLADLLTGIETRPLLLNFNYKFSKNVRYYLDFLSVLKSLSLVKNYVRLNSSYVEDNLLDFELFVYNSQQSGCFGFKTIEEKIDLLDKLGFKEGSILCLVERDKISTFNPTGNIVNAKIVRYMGINNGKSLVFESLVVLRNHEEILTDFYQIPLQNQELYLDMLEPSEIVASTEEILLMDLGIGDYFENERYLINFISTDFMVDKLIRVDGSDVTMSLSEADSIYYTLVQARFNFDKDLFRSMYCPEGGTLLADELGSRLFCMWDYPMSVFVDLD